MEGPARHSGGLASQYAQLRGQSKVQRPPQAAVPGPPRRALAGTLLGNFRQQRDAALLRAASVGYDCRILRLFTAGCNLDCRDQNGNTALSLAVWSQHHHTAHLLLRLGADPAAANNAGDGALQVALAVHSPASLLEALSLSCPLPSPRSPPLPPLCLTPASAAVRTGGTVVELVPPTHPFLLAKGSYVLDNCFSERFLLSLEALFEGPLRVHVRRSIPSSAGDGDGSQSEGKDEGEGRRKKSDACSDRVYFSDLTGHHALRGVQAVLAAYHPTCLLPSAPPAHSAPGAGAGRLVSLSRQDPCTPYAPTLTGGQLQLPTPLLRPCPC